MFIYDAYDVHQSYIYIYIYIYTHTKIARTFLHRTVGRRGARPFLSSINKFLQPRQLTRGTKKYSYVLDV
jgi:hypothetical protein